MKKVRRDKQHRPEQQKWKKKIPVSSNSRKYVTNNKKYKKKTYPWFILNSIKNNEEYKLCQRFKPYQTVTGCKSRQ